MCPHIPHLMPLFSAPGVHFLHIVCLQIPHLMPLYSAPGVHHLRTKGYVYYWIIGCFAQAIIVIFTTLEAINKNTSISTKENSFFSLHLFIIYLFIADAQVVVNEAGNELEVRKLWTLGANFQNIWCGESYHLVRRYGTLRWISMVWCGDWEDF